MLGRACLDGGRGGRRGCGAAARAGVRQPVRRRATTALHNEAVEPQPSPCCRQRTRFALGGPQPGVWLRLLQQAGGAAVGSEPRPFRCAGCCAPAAPTHSRLTVRMLHTRRHEHTYRHTRSKHAQNWRLLAGARSAALRAGKHMRAAPQHSRRPLLSQQGAPRGLGACRPAGRGCVPGQLAGSGGGCGAGRRARRMHAPAHRAHACRAAPRRRCRCCCAPITPSWRARPCWHLLAHHPLWPPSAPSRTPWLPSGTT